MKPDTRRPTLDTSRLDLVSIRKRLASSQGQDYWRCLEELADSKEFHEFLAQEFPQQTAGWTDGVSRRDFLRLMGASLALAGLNRFGKGAPMDKNIVAHLD